MNHIPKNITKKIHMDWSLWFYITLLNLTSIAIFYSTSHQSWLLFKQQCFHVLLGQCCLFVVAQVHPKRLYRWAPYFYIISLLLLVLVYFLGSKSNGAQRWLSIGFFTFQPSELLKLSVPMILARIFHDAAQSRIEHFLSHSTRLHRYHALWLGLPLTICPLLLVIKQPDLGTAITIALSSFFILLFTGINLYIMGACILTCIPILWVHLHDYQRQRLLTFLQPEHDPLGTGYHIMQSKIAIGSGGLIGKGWRHSTQSLLHFLPEHTTDFIFSVFAEQLGWVGCCLLIMLFFVMIWRTFRFSLRVDELFERLLMSTLSLVFFTSAALNIGMVSGLVPIVGIPLPCISHGGSALITYMIGFGMMISVISHRKLM